MKSNNRIGILCYSLFAGGAERNAINIALYFKQLKVPFDLILFKKLNDYQEEYGASLKSVPIVSILPFQQSFPLLLKPFLYLYFFFKLLVLVKKYKYTHLIGSVEYDPFYITVCISKIFNLKSILIVGNNIRQEIIRYGRFRRWIIYWLFKWSFSNCSKIICVSNGLRIDVISYFKLNSAHVVTIYNGINLSLISRALNRKSDRFEKKSIKRSSTIIYFGRLVEKKGIPHLINAFDIVAKQVRGCSLTIVGKGPLERELKSQTKRLHLDTKITFIGFIKKNPYSMLKKMDLLVFPSLYEGFGNVIIEAMKSGLPVISTNCPFGPSEILGSRKLNLKTIDYAKWGILTPYIRYNDSPSEIKQKEKILAKAIISVLKSKKIQRRYSRASKLRSAYFSSNRMAHNLLSEIELCN